MPSVTPSPPGTPAANRSESSPPPLPSGGEPTRVDMRADGRGYDAEQAGAAPGNNSSSGCSWLRSLWSAIRRCFYCGDPRRESDRVVFQPSGQGSGPAGTGPDSDQSSDPASGPNQADPVGTPPPSRSQNGHRVLLKADQGLVTFIVTTCPPGEEPPRVEAQNVDGLTGTIVTVPYNPSGLTTLTCLRDGQAVCFRANQDSSCKLEWDDCLKTCKVLPRDSTSSRGGNQNSDGDGDGDKKVLAAN